MKKRKNIELNVDSIGDKKPLSKEEELRISEFIRLNRQKRISRRKPRRKATI